MPETSFAKLRFPVGSDAPNVPQYIQQLAVDVDNRFNPDTYPIQLANAAFIAGVGLAGYIDGGGFKSFGGSVGNPNSVNATAGTPLIFIPPDMLPTVTRMFIVPLLSGAGPAQAVVAFNPDGWVRVARDVGTVPANSYWYFDAVRYRL